jgi:hypothetical protein
LLVLAADVEARGAEASELGERGAYITPRALMSILRLSQVRLALMLTDLCTLAAYCRNDGTPAATMHNSTTRQ